MFLRSPSGAAARSGPQLPGSAARSVVAKPALAVIVTGADTGVRTLDAAGTATLVTDVARGATPALDARVVFAVVPRRAALPVLALVRAVAIAIGAAAALTGTGAALAIIVATADAGVRTFDAALAAALVGHVARSATLVLDARGAFAIVARRAALRFLATVRAVAVAIRSAAALTGASPALAVFVTAATAGILALHATVAATPAREIARGTTFLIDACLELSAGIVADAILPERGTRPGE